MSEDLTSATLSPKEQRRWQRELEASRAQAAVGGSGGVNDRLAAASSAASASKAAAGGGEGSAGMEGIGNGTTNIEAKARQLAQAATSGNTFQQVKASAQLAGALTNTEELKQLGGAAFKTHVINRYVWPATADVVTGAGFVALTCLQVYWCASIIGVDGTVPMKTWEHFAIAVLTVLEFAIIGFLVLMLTLAACLAAPLCAVSVASQIGTTVFQQYFSGFF